MNRGVFISKPNSVTDEQRAFCQDLNKLVEARGWLPLTVGDTVMTGKSPIVKVGEVMRECSGCIVLGLKQLRIERAVLKAGTPDEEELLDTWDATPWNHMEAILAYSLRLPMLLVRERRVQSIGVLKQGVLPEYTVLEAERLDADWLASPAFAQPFNEWARDVRKFSEGAP